MLRSGRSDHQPRSADPAGRASETAARGDRGRGRCGGDHEPAGAAVGIGAAAGARDPVRHADRQLGGAVLRLPGARPEHRRRHRLVDRRGHRRVLRRPGGVRAGRDSGRSLAGPVRAPPGHDRRVGAGACRPSLVIGTTRSFPVFVAGWLLAGVAMAGTLYPPAFAALTRWWGRRRVTALTALTLLAGLSSTVFAPLTATLLDHLQLAAQLPGAGRRARR